VAINGAAKQGNTIDEAWIGTICNKPSFPESVPIAPPSFDEKNYKKV
jgi:hypothetical protein